MAAVSRTSAATVIAGRKAVVGDRLGAARRGLLERDAQRDAHVAAACTCRTSAAGRGSTTKERVEDVREPKARATKDVGHVHVVRAKAARTIGRAITVVVRALARVREHGIGLVDLLEALLGPRLLVDVWVQRARLLQERTLDGLVVCVMVDAQNLVVVSLLIHA